MAESNSNTVLLGLLQQVQNKYVRQQLILEKTAAELAALRKQLGVKE